MIVQRPRAPRALRGVAAALVVALALTACGTDEEPAADGTAPESGGEVTVVATTSILGDVVAGLLEDDGTVEVLIPPGADPHGFEPSARDAAMLREADLVVANGLRLEESLVSALETAEAEGVRIIEVAPRVDPLDFAEDPEDDGHDDDHDDHDEDGDDDHDDEGVGDADAEDDGHDHGPQDPHFWHDPVRMADAARVIAEELASVSEAVDAETWQARADARAEEILAVHDEVAEILAAVPDERRKLVTSHDSFGYLAARYDFEVIGTVVPGSTTDAEANPAAFAELIGTLEEAGVDAVFSENVESDRLSDQLASEVRDRGGPEIEVIELFSDALGEPGSGGESYLGLLRTNAERIADGLR